MAEIRTADIVLSLTGRDRGQLMLGDNEENATNKVAHFVTLNSTYFM